MLPESGYIDMKYIMSEINGDYEFYNIIPKYTYMFDSEYIRYIADVPYGFVSFADMYGKSYWMNNYNNASSYTTRNSWDDDAVASDYSQGQIAISRGRFIASDYGDLLLCQPSDGTGRITSKSINLTTTFLYNSWIDGDYAYLWLSDSIVTYHIPTETVLNTLSYTGTVANAVNGYDVISKDVTGAIHSSGAYYPTIYYPSGNGHVIDSSMLLDEGYDTTDTFPSMTLFTKNFFVMGTDGGSITIHRRIGRGAVSPIIFEQSVQYNIEYMNAVEYNGDLRVLHSSAGDEACAFYVLFRTGRSSFTQKGLYSTNGSGQFDTAHFSDDGKYIYAYRSYAVPQSSNYEIYREVFEYDEAAVDYTRIRTETLTTLGGRIYSAYSDSLFSIYTGFSFSQFDCLLDEYNTIEASSTGARAAIDSTISYSSSQWPSDSSIRISASDDILVMNYPKNGDGRSAIYEKVNGEWSLSSSFTGLTSGVSACTNGHRVALNTYSSGHNRVQIFTRGASSWGLAQTITCPDSYSGANAYDLFGYDIAMDGDLMVITHPYIEGTGSGAGYLYQYNNATKSYEYVQKLEPDYMYYGRVCKIAFKDDLIVMSGLSSGKIAVFERTDSVFEFKEWILDENIEPEFVGISNGYIVAWHYDMSKDINSIVCYSKVDDSWVKTDDAPLYYIATGNYRRAPVTSMTSNGKQVLFTNGGLSQGGMRVYLAEVTDGKILIMSNESLGNYNQEYQVAISDNSFSILSYSNDTIYTRDFFQRSDNYYSKNVINEIADQSWASDTGFFNIGSNMYDCKNTIYAKGSNGGSVYYIDTDTSIVLPTKDYPQVAGADNFYGNEYVCGVSENVVLYSDENDWEGVQVDYNEGVAQGDYTRSIGFSGKYIVRYYNNSNTETTQAVCNERDQDGNWSRKWIVDISISGVSSSDVKMNVFDELVVFRNTASTLTVLNVHDGSVLQTIDIPSEGTWYRKHDYLFFSDGDYVYEWRVSQNTGLFEANQRMQLPIPVNNPNAIQYTLNGNILCVSANYTLFVFEKNIDRWMCGDYISRTTYYTTSMVYANGILYSCPDVFSNGVIRRHQLNPRS